ncbi:MAG: dihydrolipoyl dehydrogenase [Thermoanaerobaculia bacterium]
MADEIVLPPAAGTAADLTTQLVVVGSGPGGYTAAFRAADLGLEVTLVERFATLGGVCLNVGCIPSKALLHAAQVIDEAKSFAEHGIRFGAPEIDLTALGAWRSGVVSRLTGGIAAMAKRRNVRVIQGMATLLDPHRLEVLTPGGPVHLRFEQAILAVGSRTFQPPGLDLADPRLITSTEALALPDVPSRLLVVGGGIIGLEMACVYAALGSRITVVELLDRLIPEADADIVKPLARRLAGRYEGILLETKVSRLEPRPEGLLAHFEGKNAPAEPQLFDRVLVAVGRRPNGDRIGAEAAGLIVDAKGFLPVDRQMRTNLPHIFAIGDVARPPMLAHKASHEGKVAAEVAAGHKSAFDARVIPAVAYTDPEIAWVGLTERQAEAQGVAYEKASFPWSASGRALSLGREEGSTKLLFDPASRRLLGAAAVGVHAGDLISEAALAIEMGCEAADLALTVHPHPTLAETVAFAAEVFEGTVTDLYLPRKRERKAPSA